jgi:hypothetical protein
VKGRGLKQNVLKVVGNTSLNEALNQTVELEVAMAAAEPAARLRNVQSRTTRLPRQHGCHQQIARGVTCMLAVWEHRSSQKRLSVEI